MTSCYMYIFSALVPTQWCSQEFDEVGASGQASNRKFFATGSHIHNGVLSYSIIADAALMLVEL